MSTRQDRLLTLTTAAIVVAAVAVWLRPGGVMAQFRQQWQERHARARAYAALLEATDATRSEERVVTTGRQDAPVVFEVFDYECPYCRTVHAVVDSLEASGVFRVRYIHMPLPNHALARPAAIAAECARKQGDFQAMHNELMTTDEWRRGESLSEVARRSGVTDSVAFATCLNAPSTSARIDSMIALAKAIGVNGTPFFLGPQGLREGAGSAAQLSSLAAE